MFEDSALVEQAKTLVLALPADKTVALVGVVNTTGAHAIFVARVNNLWSVQSYVELDSDHKLDYGASVMFSK